MAEDYLDERMKILEMIEAGDISPSDGLQLLEALTGEADASAGPDLLRIEAPIEGEASAAEAVFGEPEVEVLAAPQPAAGPGTGLDAASWRGWWKYVFWTGAAVMFLGAFLLLTAAQLSASGFWYFCAGIPFLFGLLILLLGVYSRSSRWIHIRIQQPPGEFPSKISLSFPLPIRPAVWFIRVFKRWIPGLDSTGLDELIIALGNNATPETPLYVQVQDDEDGEQVEVYIG
jgi:hypothetical protein